MSQRLRLLGGASVAALTVALLGGPVWAGATVGAPELVFSGGGVLRCDARPNRSSLAVGPNSTVRVVNHTGRRAQLLINNVAKGQLQDSQSAEVLFHRGSAALALRPNCVLGTRPTVAPVQVTAGPAPSAPTDSRPGGTDVPARPAPRPGRTALPAASPTGPAGGSTDSSDDGDRPGKAPRGRPSTPPAATATPIASGPPLSQPGGGAPTVGPSTAPTGATPTGAAAVPTGPPPLNPAVPAAGAPRRGTLPEAPRNPAARPDLTIVGAEPTGRPKPAVVPDAPEPSVAMIPVHGRSPFALLVVVAGICLFGVGTALIRTIASERALRTKVA